ncbi:MAG TPA: tetratricopeptide repeat protein, partial [Thermoanaerobaculia bacterium]|nr:tetratricopeptide repeat protein [Thermoanaerobaculia bacterium]
MITAALPVPLGCLVGRRAELRQVGELLAGSRLVTLTGAGGSGKTRLAIEAAARFTGARLPAGRAPGPAAVFVDLAPLADPELLPDHLAARFDVRPVPGRSLVAGLVAALQGLPLLLVLDNCEHLVDRCAVLVESLLQGCAALRVLTTSREPLGLAGECLWLVPPLSLPSLPPAVPDPDGAAVSTQATDPAASDAVQLFAVRAREANPAFRLSAENLPAVAAICRRLDGLPLALELAAARTRVLSVEQIAERLDDAFRLLTTGGRTSLPRQKTLRGTFDWSHDLLARDQQVLLRRLAVFAGSFSLEAVEGICAGDGIAADQVLDALSSLVDRSLVMLDPDEGAARYRLLETVRQYARERLAAAGEEEVVARRHAAWYTELAEALAPEHFGGQGPAALMRRLDHEHDNFRLAADWALRVEDGGEIALRLGYALHWYWFARGLFPEGWRRLASALVHGCHAAPTARARAAVAAGSVSVWLGRPEAARSAVAQAVEALRTAGDAFALGYGLAIHGAVSLAPDPELAARVLDEAEAVVAPLPRGVLTAFVGYWRGQAAQVRGDLATARAALEGSLALGRALGNLPSIGHSLHLLGRLERCEGRLERARELLAEALEVHVRSGDRWGISLALLEIAQVERERGEPHRAARILAAMLRQAEQAGIAPGDERAAEAARLGAELRAELGEAEYAAQAERGSRVGALQALELLGGGEGAVHARAAVALATTVVATTPWEGGVSAAGV